MSSPKTQPTAASVEEFLDKVPDEQTRQDCLQLVDILRSITGEEPKLWGPSIVGFGTYHYVYASGREGDGPLAGFSPRKHNLSLYLTCDIQQYADLLDQLGPHTCGKGCLYIRRMSDVHLPTLKKLIKTTVQRTRKEMQSRSAPKASRRG